ncbi:hypothetical protein DPMN_185162 [Dreissena polymorpha]|uniref:Uncharacterized protein n=1 Tax=Dreissena polymorpha TaxID=45954 RepID=A0A9D4DN37_DREPO|nr:hypothetical protein DPMN_185162 [Dreissena polymorpha]
MSSDAYVFSGEKCEVRVERLQLESKYIVAIAASVGGVIVISSAVIIVCLVFRLRRKAPKDADERFVAVTIDLCMRFD